MEHSDNVQEATQVHKENQGPKEMITALLKSAGEIEGAIRDANAELLKGFDGLSGDLTQIQSRIKELRKFANETNLAVLASINQARQTCLESIDPGEMGQVIDLYVEGRLKNSKRKLSFT